MADLETLKRALKNADAAGDTVAAKKFADAIRAQQGGASSAAPDAPATPSRASQIAKGVLEAEQRRQADVAEYQAMPWYQKPLQAAGDVAMTAAHTVGQGYDEKARAGIKSLFGQDYDQALAESQRATEAARNRFGNPGTAAALDVATLMEGLPARAVQGANFVTRTGLNALEGAGFGAWSAGGHDQNPVTGAGVGAAQGAIGNLAGEAVHGASKLFDQGKQVLTDPTFRQEMWKMARDSAIGGGAGYVLDQLTGYADPLSGFLVGLGRRALPGGGGVPKLPATQPSPGAPDLRDTLAKLAARIPVPWGDAQK